MKKTTHCFLVLLAVFGYISIINASQTRPSKRFLFVAGLVAIATANISFKPVSKDCCLEPARSRMQCFIDQDQNSRSEDETTRLYAQVDAFNHAHWFCSSGQAE